MENGSEKGKAGAHGAVRARDNGVLKTERGGGPATVGDVSTDGLSMTGRKWHPISGQRREVKSRSQFGLSHFQEQTTGKWKYAWGGSLQRDEFNLELTAQWGNKQWVMSVKTLHSRLRQRKSTCLRVIARRYWLALWKWT